MLILDCKALTPINKNIKWQISFPFGNKISHSKESLKVKHKRSAQVLRDFFHHTQESVDSNVNLHSQKKNLELLWTFTQTNIST